jgi:hypothetical protein
MDETLLKAEELKNVRMAAWLSKRSSSFPHGWAQRYVVLSANLLYIYTQPLDAKPKRVVLVDDATATVRTRLDDGSQVQLARSGDAHRLPTIACVCPAVPDPHRRPTAATRASRTPSE